MEIPKSTLLIALLLLPSACTGEGGSIDFDRCELQRPGLQCFLSESGIMELFNPPRGALDNTTTAQYFFNKKFVGKLCTLKEGLKRAFSCVYSAVEQCMRDNQWLSWLSYLPDVSKCLSVIDDVCEAVDDTNYACVINVTEKLVVCASEKGDTMNINGPEAQKEGVCQFFLESAECFEHVLSDCGCPTTRLAVKSVKNLNPPVCSAIEVATPECYPFSTHHPAHTTTPITGGSEIGKGGARQSSGLASLITMLLVLLMSRAAV